MKILLTSFFLLPLFFSSCKKIDKITQFEMVFDEEIIIPASTGINLPFNLFTPDINTNSETTFESNDTRKDLVEEIKLTQLDLTLNSPNNGNFQFLKSINIYISADGLPEFLIASKDNIPANIGKYITLETVNTDIKDYIKKDQYSLKVNTVTDELIAADHHINIHSVFFINAKIFKK